MDIETAKFAFQIAQFALTCGVGFYVYMSNKDKVTNDRIGSLQEDLDVKLDGHSERIARLETGPTHADLGDLHERINSVAKGVDTLTGEFHGVRTTLNLIHDYLLKGKR